MLVCIIVWIDSGNKYKKETLDETKPKSRANRVRQSPDFVLTGNLGFKLEAWPIRPPSPRTPCRALNLCLGDRQCRLPPPFLEDRQEEPMESRESNLECRGYKAPVTSSERAVDRDHRQSASSLSGARYPYLEAQGIPIQPQSCYPKSRCPTARASPDC